MHRRTHTMMGFMAFISAALSVAPVTGQPLQLVQEIFDDVDGVDGLAGNRWAELSPDGRHLYVAGQAEDEIAVFARDFKTGRLTQVQVVANGIDASGLDGVSAIEVTRDGRHAYAVSIFDRAIATFERDPGSGRLQFVEALFQGVDVPVGLFFAVWAESSGDGRFIYTTAFFDHTILVFGRDIRSGKLELVQTLRDGVDGVDFLQGVFPLAMSPDGENVYAGALFDNAITAYERDRVTGRLRFVHVVENGVGGVSGLGFVRGLTVSRDGSNLYSVASGSSALATFGRDPVTGGLDFRGTIVDGVGGVDGLGGAVFVTESPNGSQLHVASFGDDAIATFHRDRPSGVVNFVDVTTVPSQGLFGALTATVSPDGRHLYTAASFPPVLNPGSVLVFEILR